MNKKAKLMEKRLTKLYVEVLKLKDKSSLFEGKFVELEKELTNTKEELTA